MIKNRTPHAAARKVLEQTMKESVDNPRGKLEPRKNADKSWYLSLLDGEEQQRYEEERLKAVLVMLKLCYLSRYRNRIREAKKEEASLNRGEEYAAENYRRILELHAEIGALEKKLNAYKCYFTETYFARMDVVDDKEGYNSYYIGKRGDVNLEIVDWRAPLAVRYYQKSRVNFKINEYEYRTVLRRSLSVKNGKVLGFKNEYLSVRDVLTPEEIAGRDEEILFDPYLREIIRDRKDDVSIRDIIRTIQEQQFDVITRPERESFVLQGCAGSGKTMIMLHRLSYLMYNNEALSPKDVLVITPSDSFNAFIDELSQVLELQKVRTVTLKDYYFRALSNEGIDLGSRLGGARESEDYLYFVYSPAFTQELARDVGKLYSDVYGLFMGEECREVSEKVLSDCIRRQKEYRKIKNASVRLRRCVLGELKERKEGGFYFTKPLRGLMSEFVQVEDFLRFVLGEETRSPDYFFRQFTEFYRCAKDISNRAEKVFSAAEEDLAAFLVTVEKEIADLRRYRIKTGEKEVFTYAERIERRLELKKEAEDAAKTVREMEEGLELFREFFLILRLSEVCADAGRCENAVDVARFFYRRTVKQYKNRYGMHGIFPSDGYALCALLTAAGRQLAPRYGLVFIDEGQDVSAEEYALLRKIHAGAAFNVFGDLKQNITPWRGVGSWEGFEHLYELNRNYRNTNEIVEYVSGITDVKMSPIGLHGAETVVIPPRKLSAFFRGKQGLKAVIVREEYLPLFAKRGFAFLSSGKKVSKSKVNVMTVFESKGLEFSCVAVYDKGMTENEKYIACTRALKELAIVAD